MSDIPRALNWPSDAAESRDLTVQFYQEWQLLDAQYSELLKELDCDPLSSRMAALKEEMADCIRRLRDVEIQIIRTPAATANGLAAKCFILARALYFKDCSDIDGWLWHVVEPADDFRAFYQPRP